jgi:NDP-sugar pyrophosphorylase family protein
MDMTELIKLLVCQGEKVVSFPIIEYWLDIGSPEDYQRAQEFARNGAAG